MSPVYFVNDVPGSYRPLALFEKMKPFPPNERTLPSSRTCRTFEPT